MKKRICVLVGNFLINLDRFKAAMIREYQKKMLQSCGTNVYIGSNCVFTYANVSLGCDVYVGRNCIFQSSYGKIKIGNHVMFGPGVNIHGGNHKIREIGCLLDSVSEKKVGDDGIIEIEDDCWIGANAMILSGVKIGRGSVIGGGSIVTKDIPPYSIYTGTPANKLRARFCDEDLRTHLSILKESQIK